MEKQKWWIKRSVIYQSLSSGGLNFPNFRTVVQSLFLSWLGRFLNRTNKSWQAIPNDSFQRYGGLPFLLKCNYDSKLVDKRPPLFYSEMLDNFKELRTGHPDVYRSELVLWNNKEIKIENKSIFWAHLFEKGICFVQDLLDKNGKFLSLDDLPVKYNVHLKFLQYFQLIAAIPSCLKKTAQEIAVTKTDLLKEQEVFYFSDNRPLSLTKLRSEGLLQFISGR